MRTENKISWWREIGAVSQGLLFLDGHITRPEAVHSAQAAYGAHGRQRHHRADLHERAVKVLAARRRRHMLALSLFR